MPEPALPEDITGRELAGAVRSQLRPLDKDNAETVSKHLVAAGRLLGVRLVRATASVVTDGAEVTGVRLDDGSTVAAGTVVFTKRRYTDKGFEITPRGAVERLPSRPPYNLPAVLAQAAAGGEVWVVEGAVELTWGEEAWRLEAGDCLSMRLDRPTVFRNPAGEPARYLVALAADPGGPRRGAPA